MKERYKQAMIAGKGPEEHLYDENSSAEKGVPKYDVVSGDKLPLTKGCIVPYINGNDTINCTIKDCISLEGSCSIIYLVEIKSLNMSAVLRNTPRSRFQFLILNL